MGAFKKITAVIQSGSLGRVEVQLQGIGVRKLTVWRVRGRGEYVNFYSHDPHVDLLRMEIFAPAHRADEIARVIMDSARTGQKAGDGLVVISPVDSVYRVRTGQTPDLGELIDIP